MPVDWDTYKQNIRQLYDKHASHPNTAFKIFVGVGSGDKDFTVETRADNLRAPQFFDIYNRRPGVSTSFMNDPLGPSSFTFDVRPLAETLRKNKINVVVSSSAGDFLCEALLYELGTMRAKGEIQAGVFIHVPLAITSQQADALGKALARTLSPEGDFDGDGIVNSKDPNPFDSPLTR